MQVSADYIITTAGKKINKADIHKIGVTGIYAGGKGTVCSLLEKRGAYVIDSDLIAREAVAKGSNGLSQLVKEFGAGILDEEGNLARKKLADLVFGNKERVDKLNSMVHPRVRELTVTKIKNQLNLNPRQIFALNIPLLFEAKREDSVDLILVVNSSLEDSIRRGMQRDGLTREEIISRIQHQIPLNEKIPRADYVIENSGTLEETEKQVESFWRLIQRSEE